MKSQNCATDCVKKVKKQGFIHNLGKVLSTSYEVRMAFSKAGNLIQPT